MKVYGIPNCDTVKKALSWLEENDLKYDFHNFKKEGISKRKLEEWISEKGWEVILNRKSATFRKLLLNGIKEPTTKASAISLMVEHTSSIKRPVVEKDGMLVVGFNETEMKSLLKTK